MGRRGRRTRRTARAGGKRTVTRLESTRARSSPRSSTTPRSSTSRGCVEAAGAAARLALEDVRLQADLKAQLARVRESRERIVTAADEERRRLERDLHDGVQQRLLAVALELRRAQRTLADGAEPALERLLAVTVDELQGAVEELRELAHGVHPPVPTQQGLAAALELVASRTALPVEVDVVRGRLPERVEATAYFVACEALANVVKHARATRAPCALRARAAS